MTNLSYLGGNLVISNGSGIFQITLEWRIWIHYWKSQCCSLRVETNNELFVFIIIIICQIIIFLFIFIQIIVSSIITFIYLPWGSWKHSKPVSQWNRISSLHLWTSCLYRKLFLNKTCSDIMRSSFLLNKLNMWHMKMNLSLVLFGFFNQENWN